MRTAENASGSEDDNDGARECAQMEHARDAQSAVDIEPLAV